MPTYEYICEKCGHQFDKFQSIADNPLRFCPKELCGLKRWGKGKVKKLIGAGAGLIFKGSGFYITDYRSEGYKQAAKKEAGDSSPVSTDGKAAGAKAKEGKPAKPEAKPTPRSGTSKD